MLSTSGEMLNFPSSGEYNPSPEDAGAVQRHRVQVMSLQTVSTNTNTAKKTQTKKRCSECLMCYC